MRKSKSKNEIIIDVQGRFDYKMHRVFRDAYRYEKPGSTFVINMLNAKSMDSSALGMLLLLREHVGVESVKIKIKNCNEAILRILDLTRFTDIFDVT